MSNGSAISKDYIDDMKLILHRRVWFIKHSKTSFFHRMLVLTSPLLSSSTRVIHNQSVFHNYKKITIKIMCVRTSKGPLILFMLCSDNGTQASETHF